MWNLRRLVLLCAVWLGQLAAPPAHAGIPVIDSANLAQAVQELVAWAQQYEQMTQQIQQLNDQIDQTRTMTGKLDVARLLGSILNDPQVRLVLPGEMRNHTALSQGAPYGGSRLDAINTLLAGYGVQTRYGHDPTPAGQTAADALLKMQSVLQSAQLRQNQVNALAARVDSAPDAKASMDLVSRNVIETTRVTMDLQQTLASIEANRQAERLRHLAADQARIDVLRAKAAATRAELGL